MPYLQTRTNKQTTEAMEGPPSSEDSILTPAELKDILHELRRHPPIEHEDSIEELIKGLKKGKLRAWDVQQELNKIFPPIRFEGFSKDISWLQKAKAVTVSLTGVESSIKTEYPDFVVEPTPTFSEINPLRIVRIFWVNEEWKILTAQDVSAC